jgi:hypothetical protein
MKILTIDESTGVGQAEAERLGIALVSKNSYIAPQLGVNVEKINAIPDLINVTPAEILCVQWADRYRNPSTVHKTFAGTAAAGDLTFAAADLNEKVANNHEIIGLDFNIRFSGDESSPATGIVISGTGMYGDYSLNTQIISPMRKSTRVVLLFHGMADGQIRLNPVSVGVHHLGQVAGVLNDTPGYAGSPQTWEDRTLTVSVSNALNKTVKVTLIDQAYREMDHLAQMIAPAA